MKRLSLCLVLLVSLSACATLHDRYHFADGRWNVTQIVSDAGFGLQEGCQVGWVPADVCTLGNDTLAILNGFAAQQVPVPAIRQALVDIEAKWPADSKLRAYFDWILLLLPSA